MLVITAYDALDTLISTRIRIGTRWPTELYYRWTWPPCRAIARRFRNPAMREALLAAYGPLSVVGLLALWVTGQILGWSLIWWGLRNQLVPEPKTLIDTSYYSGIVYFSIGFGDVLPRGGFIRVLTIAEAFGGLGTMGLVIGYFPGLYAAYQSRERQLFRLDDLTDARITPMGLFISIIGPNNDTSRLDPFFEEWSNWVAELYETHSSFPMLMFFRSKLPGQSWVTALGVVSDTAVTAMSALPPDESESATRFYRLAVRTFEQLTQRSHVPVGEFVPFPARFFSLAYTALQNLGLDLQPFDRAYSSTLVNRSRFHPQMETLIDMLDTPRGFWGATSAEAMTAPSFASLLLNDDDEPPEPVL